MAQPERSGGKVQYPSSLPSLCSWALQESGLEKEGSKHSQSSVTNGVSNEYLVPYRQPSFPLQGCFGIVVF